MKRPPIIPNTWAEGLNPTYQEMDETGTKLFFHATMSEMDDPDRKINFDDEENETLFLALIVKKRIEVLKLPIKFTDTTLLGMCSLVRSPGDAVVLLVDCLNAFEGQTVTMDKLSKLYSWGFYDEKTMENYIDNYMKKRTVKWSEIY